MAWAPLGGSSIKAWAAGTAYKAGDVVSYRGVLYLALIDMAAVGSVTSAVADDLTTATTRPSWLQDGLLPTSVSTRAADGTTISGEGAILRDAPLGSAIDFQGTLAVPGSGSSATLFVGGGWGNTSDFFTSVREGVYIGITSGNATAYGLARGDASLSNLGTISWTLSAGEKIVGRIQLTSAGVLTISITRAGVTTVLSTTNNGARFFSRDLRHGMRTFVNTWKLTNFSSTIVTPGAFPMANFMRLSSPVTRDDDANSTFSLMGA